jgi:hypothetical protein
MDKRPPFHSFRAEISVLLDDAVGNGQVLYTAIYVMNPSL